MLINNPRRNIKLIDLVDFYDPDFSYNKIYDFVSNWLKTEKQYLVNENMFDDFIQILCDRFYERDLNFDTFLDAKIKIRNVLRKNREKAKRMYIASLIEINPLNTYEHLTDNETNGTGSNESNTTSNIHSKDENGTTSNTRNSGTDTNKGYNLHSDTPSDSLNVTDLVSSGSNYITDVQNNKSDTIHGHVVDGIVKGNSEGETNSNTHNASDYKDDRFFKEVAKGYDGHPAELLNKFVNLNLDVVNFYIEQIEREAIFSNILY